MDAPARDSIPKTTPNSSQVVPSTGVLPFSVYRTFGTGIMTSTGSRNDDWTVCTSEGIAPDPITGTNKKIKMVDRKIDADNYVLEMYDTNSDGEERQILHVEM